MLIAAGLLLLAATVLPIIRASAQQAVVTDQNVDQMIATAKAPADHEAIAAYYDREAAENEKKEHLHRLTENMYTKTINLAHCSALVAAYRQAANEDKALAAACY